MKSRFKATHFRRVAARVVGAACLLGASAASAFTTDARRLGMGGVLVPGGRDMAAANVAYQTMPSRPGSHGAVVPLPLGLVQLATDFPTFDPEDPDFSVTRLANLALNPPFFLELSDPAPLDGDISISIARNEFSILFEDAERLLPQEPIAVGSLYARPLVGLGLLGARTYLSPVVLLEGNLAFDDALYGVLVHGAPLRPNSEYHMTAGGETMAGTALNLGFSDGGWGSDNGDGFYVGTYVKYILGLGFGQAETTFGLVSADTIFGSSDPLDVAYDAVSRYATFGSIGHGVGFDTGVAYRRGHLDYGLGFRDLGSRVHWSSVEVGHAYLDEATDEVVTESWTSEAGYTVRVPIQTTLNAAWTGLSTVVAADLTTSRWGTGLHLGAERRVGPLALRGGLSSVSQEGVQYAWGVGVGLSRLWLDFGFQTHSRSFTGERGLTFGTSLALR